MSWCRVVVVIAVVGVATSWGFFLLIRCLEDDRSQAEFARLSASLTTALQRASESGLAEIDNLASLYLASDRVERREFETYVRRILAKHKSIRALEWVPRIPGPQRAAFEAGEGAGAPLPITERGADGGIRPAAMRPEYFPVQYVEPQAPNATALGYDLASEPSRRYALTRAAETGLQTATRPVGLVQAAPGELGFIAVNPIYLPGAQPGSPAARRSALTGYVAGVFVIPELADYAFLGQRPAWAGVTIEDVTNPDHPLPIYARDVEEPHPGIGPFTYHLQVAGRDWELRFVPGRAHIIAQRTPSPSSILAAGLLMTAILATSFANATRHAERSQMAEVETVEAVRTREAAFVEAALLDGITRKINAGLGIDEILDFVYNGFEGIIPYDRIGLALVDGDGRTVRSRWSRSRAGDMAITDGFAAPLDGSSLMGVFESGQPRIIDDLQAYSAAHPGSASARLIVKEGMRSSLTCPIMIRNRAAGFLFFSSSQPNSYEPGHVATFTRLAGHLSVIVEVGLLFEALAREEKRSEQILNSLLPKKILRRVKAGERLIADEIASASVVFADLVGFTAWSGEFTSSELVGLLNRLFRRFDLLAHRRGLVKIGTQGDGYLAVAGIPTPHPDHARLAAEYALAIQRAVGEFHAPDGAPLSLRVGIHSGPVVAGVLGQLAWRYDVWGRTVNLASRMESLGEPGRIQVSSETATQLRQQYRLTRRPPIDAKGFGQLQTYWLEGRRKEAPFLA